jgi:hypothetical protein
MKLACHKVLSLGKHDMHIKVWSQAKLKQLTTTSQKKCVVFNHLLSNVYIFWPSFVTFSDVDLVGKNLLDVWGELRLHLK